MTNKKVIKYNKYDINRAKPLEGSLMVTVELPDMRSLKCLHENIN